ncbi:MAG TPA: metal-dependent hydrolase, partial [Byssovorax sp.]
YDVYLAAGGTYAERVFVMAIASAIFYAKVLEHQARFMRADGTLYSASEWLALGRYLFVEPGVLRAIARLYGAYYRPGFHPKDVDCDDLIARWSSELEGSEIYARAAA